MNKDTTVSTYLTLSKEGIESTKKMASKSAEETYGVEDPLTKDTLMYENLDLRLDEITFDKNDESINFYGDFYSGEVRLGYLNQTIKLNHDILIDIIEHHVKKLGKLKTIIEAIK